MLLRRAAIASAALLVTTGGAIAQNPQQQGAAAGQAAPAQQQLPPIDKNKLSYAIGFQLGSDFREKPNDIDLPTVIRALQDGHAGRDPTVSLDDMRQNLMAYQEKAFRERSAEIQKLANENKAKSDRFLAENRSKTGIQSLPNGIQYRVIEAGNGRSPSAQSEVTIHYRGSIAASGLEFDSSFARGQPVTFKVNEVLQGWQEVLPRMKIGDHWQVFLPPDKAYGERGQPPAIGPNEALAFDIKLVEIK